MASIKDNIGFKLAQIVLSQERPFTLNDIVKLSKSLGITDNEEQIKKALITLRDNWLITEDASCFSSAISQKASDN